MMNATPLPMPPEQRATLLEFESLHEQWRLVSAAADAMEHWNDGPPVDLLLQQRLAADRLHRQAMRLLRDAPI